MWARKSNTGFGGQGVIAENVRDEQRKFFKCKHLVANLLSFHTLVTMTRALQQLLQEGGTVDIDALSTLSPYRTEHINRLGNYVIDFNRMPGGLCRDRTKRRKPPTRLAPRSVTPKLGGARLE